MWAYAVCMTYVFWNYGLYLDVGRCRDSYVGTTCMLDIGCVMQVILCLALSLLLPLHFHAS